MESDRATPTPPPPVSGSHWMVSFGDLLTLLLCFFLSIVSFSPLKPEGSTSEKPLISGTYEPSGGPITASRSLPDSGTQLALPPSRRDLLFEQGARYRLLLSEEDFSPNGEQVLGRGDKSLERLATGLVEGVFAIEITTCSRAAGDGGEEARAMAMQRALTLRRQLFDGSPVKSAHSQIRYRNLGGACGEIESTVPETIPAASIEFIRML